MGAKNGRQKGSVAEREVAKICEDWWRTYELGVSFVRVPLSGGWGTPGLRKDFNACGDLATNAKSFPWTVEVKRREGWSFPHLLKGNPSPIWGWWEQSLTQAKEADKWPMLWFRKNQNPWRIMVRKCDPFVTKHRLVEQVETVFQYRDDFVGCWLAEKFVQTVGEHAKV